MPHHSNHVEDSQLSHEPAADARARATPDAIARRAYELFEERGCETGHDLDDWLRAEYELALQNETSLAE